MESSISYITEQKNERPETTQAIKKTATRYEKIASTIFLITLILAPIVFIPTQYAPLDMVKNSVITIGVLISAILYLFPLIKSKNLILPKHSLLNVSIGIILSIIISTLLSQSIIKSSFGQGFETGTASFYLLMFLVALLVINFINKEKDYIYKLYFAIITPFILVIIFQIIRLFGTNLLSFGVFQNSISSMIGRWGDLSAYSGVISILSLIIIRYSKGYSKIFNSLLYVLLVLSICFLFITNNNYIWFVYLITTGCLFVYEYHSKQTDSKGINSIFKKIPILTSVLLVISVLGFWKGDVIVGSMLSKLNIVQAEISLPWQLTIDVASDTVKETPLFGAGPNRFSYQYLKFKPYQAVNPTIFWNTEFSNGFGMIPSTVVTQGIVGLLLWIIFLVIYITTGYKILNKLGDGQDKLLIVSSFFASLFMWLVCLVYSPSHTILFITFVLSALFISFLINDGYIKLISNEKNEVSIINKFKPIIILIILVLSILWLFVYAKKVVAISYFQKGISVLNSSNNQDIAGAESLFQKAALIDKNDTYYQALSEIDIMKISSMAQSIQAEVQKSGTNPSTESINQLTKLIEESVGYTKQAINFDPTNYYNYIAGARISELALSLRVPNAYDSLLNSYNDAIKYNPYNPSIYLNLSRIQASQNKIDDSLKNIGIAVQLKPNYVDAIFLLSQIQVSQGKIKDAITSVKVASQINPTNPLLFFQLGLLYYNEKDYQVAIDSLNEAIKLDNSYANAQYFLGLAYARIGKNTDAIIQFENLSKTNPDNQEVTLILNNLRNGKSPFTDAKPPIDNRPEQRKNLPIKEAQAKTTKK